MARPLRLLALVLVPLASAAQSLPPNHPPIETSVQAPRTRRRPPPTELPVPAAPAPGARDLPAGHPPLAPPKPQDAEAADGGVLDPESLMRHLDAMGGLTQKDKPFEIASAMGRLYYAHGRFADSVKFLKEAIAKTDELRRFYFAQRQRVPGKPLPAPATLGCAPGEGVTFEALAAKAKTLAKTDGASAASCARAALQPLRELEPLLGNAQFITGAPNDAMATYDHHLGLFETSPDALYGRACLLLDQHGDDKKALQRSREDLAEYLRNYPTGPNALQAKAMTAFIDQALEAGGVTKLAARPVVAPAAPAAPPSGGAQMPVLTKEMVDAVQNTERTPELEKGLADLVEQAEEHLARHRYQEALDAYKRVVPFQPENGRARAGMAWALIGLNKQPMADRIWSVAAEGDPSAVDKLGETLKTRGDASGAKQLWQRLAQTVPAYAGRLKDKLL